MSFFFRCIPRGVLNKVLHGRVRPEAQPLTLLSTIFDRKDIPYHRSSTSNSMAWLDYKMAYDMVPGSSILNSLEMVGGSVQSRTTATATAWWTGRQCWHQVEWSLVRLSSSEEIRDIFQKDSLSVLLFIVLMLPLTLVLRKMKAGWKMVTDMRPIKHLFQSWMMLGLS